MSLLLDRQDPGRPALYGTSYHIHTRYLDTLALIAQVGTMDIEIPASHPDLSPTSRAMVATFFNWKPFSSPSTTLPQLAQALVRIQEVIKSGQGSYGSLVHAQTTTWFTKLPAFRNANLADHWPPPQNSKTAGWTVKNQRGDPPVGQPAEPVFPLMVFSHGMGGSRTAYSSLCGEFASYGFVVVALEHRDGTGPRTLVNHPLEGFGSRKERESKSDVDHWTEEAKRRYDVLDFIFPKNNPMDTRPSNPKGVDDELRTAQLALRLVEIEEAYKAMCVINEGKGSEVAGCNLRKAGGTGASSRGLEGVDWAAWKGRININSGTMLGHSFGAATSIEILRHRNRFPWVKQSIIYDIWSAPVKPAEDTEHHINTPLLGINSEAFMYWEENFKTATSLCQEASKHGAPSWLMTVRGTVHMSQTDFCLLYPHMASLFLKQTLKPQRAIDLNVGASLEFLAQAMPYPPMPFHLSLQSEGILEQQCLDELPTEHMPDQEWMAMRLKLKHEVRGRVVPKIRRWLKRVGGVDGGDKEVWMHVAPTSAEIKQWQRKFGSDVDGVDEGNGTQGYANESNEELSPGVYTMGPKDDGTISYHPNGCIQPSVEVNPPYKGFVSATTPVWPATRSKEKVLQ